MLDFDRFLKEKQGETLKVRVFGRTYEVRKEIPAIVPILMARSEQAMGKDGEEMEDGEATRLVLRAADALFGEKAMDEMAGKGLGVEDLGELVRQVFTAIQKDEEDGDACAEITDESGKRRIQAGKR